jgi:ornithine decarboxylase
VTPKIKRFLGEERPDTPCLVVDLDVVRDNYLKIKRHLPATEIHYAVKANPAPAILETLAGLGSSFDAAGAAEVDLCLAAGAPPERVVYGNTIKKQKDIAHAFGRGVGLFAFDSAEELAKLAVAAPGSRVYCRILTDDTGAGWPLTRKFGCALSMARDLLLGAGAMGLEAYGVSFHVGSQQTEPRQWEAAIERTAKVFSDLGEAGIELRIIDIGGGFPVRYRDDVPGLEEIADTIMTAMTRHFGNGLPRMIVEPGRAVAAEAGVLEAEVVLVSRKSNDDDTRWVYLDIGKFGGLAETMGEAIRYPIQTPHDGGREGPVVIAGPTCDGADVLYEEAGYVLPLDLAPGDRVRLLKAGAYTATYASAGFNGFPPPAAYYI